MADNSKKINYYYGTSAAIAKKQGDGTDLSFFYATDTYKVYIGKTLLNSFTQEEAENLFVKITSFNDNLLSINQKIKNIGLTKGSQPGSIIHITKDIDGNDKGTPTASALNSIALLRDTEVHAENSFAAGRKVKIYSERCAIVGGVENIIGYDGVQGSSLMDNVTRNAIAGGSYNQIYFGNDNLVTGYKNKIGGAENTSIENYIVSSYNLVSGYHNIIKAGNINCIMGKENKIAASGCAVFGGEYGSGTLGNIVGDYTSSIVNVYNTIVNGVANRVGTDRYPADALIGGKIYNCFISGYQNTLYQVGTDLNGVFISGLNNKVSGNLSFTHGNYLTNYRNNCVLFGQYVPSEFNDNSNNTFKDTIFAVSYGTNTSNAEVPFYIQGGVANGYVYWNVNVNYQSKMYLPDVSRIMIYQQSSGTYKSLAELLQ